MTFRRGIYRHSKTGNLYRVIGTAWYSETLEEFALYEALYKNKTSKLWIRPLAMFLEEVEIDHARVPRFRFLKNE